MSKASMGYLNVTKLLKLMAAKHSAFNKNERSGDVMVNVTLWENDEVDQYKNLFSVQLNPGKDAPDNNKEGRVYLGNFQKGIDVTRGVNDDEANMALAALQHYAEQDMQTMPPIDDKPLATDKQLDFNEQIANKAKAAGK